MEENNENDSLKENKTETEFNESAWVEISKELMSFFVLEDVRAWEELILERNIMEEEICLDLIQRKIKARGDELLIIHFKNVNPLKVGNLDYVINLIRDLK